MGMCFKLVDGAAFVYLVRETYSIWTWHLVTFSTTLAWVGHKKNWGSLGDKWSRKFA